MKKYSIYSMDIDNEQRETMLAKHGKAAQYLPFYLFGETYEQLTGLPHPHSMDLSVFNLTDTPEFETDKTFAEFDAMCDALLGGTFDGREVVLSKQQGRYLQTTRYPAPEVEGDV
jgi:hypothetical protein